MYVYCIWNESYLNEGLRDICVYNNMIMYMYIELRKRSCSSNFDFLTDDVYSWCDCR